MADSTVGTLIYKITGDASLVHKDLTKVNKEIGQTADNFDTLAASVKSFTTKVLSGVLIKTLADAASEVEELDAKFDTVFAGRAQETRAWAENYATSVNRGIIATETFMATIQDIQTGYGMATDEAAEFSKAVVGITNDLASFSNIPFDQAMQSVQSGLAQQFESLRQLGIGVSVEIINQGEYAEALGKTWLEMSNLERQQAILNEIVKQSPNALHQTISSWKDYNWQLGDAARTSDSYANTLQGFTGSLKDFTAELGDFLLPTLTTLLSVGTEALQTFRSAPDVIQGIATSIAVLAVSLKALGTGPVGIVVSAIASLTVLFTGLSESSDDLEEQTRSLASATSKYSDAVKALSGDTADLTTEQRLLYESQMKLARSDALKALKEMNSEYKTSAQEIADQREEVDKLRGEIAAFDLLARRGSGAIPAALANLPEESEAFVEAYRNILNTEALRGELTDDWEHAATARAQLVLALESDLAQTEGEVEAAVYQAAVALNEGVLTANDFIGVNEEIADAVFETARAMQEESDAVSGVSEEMAEAVQVATSWRDALKDLRLEQASQSGDYDTVFRIRASQIQQEKNAAIRALAEEYQAYISNGEDISQLTTAELARRLAANEETSAELAALETYYTVLVRQNAQDRQDAIDEEAKAEEARLEELAQKRESYTASLHGELASIQKSLKEEYASKLLDEGKVAESFDIRRQILEEDYQKELEDLEKRIAAEEASESDRLILREKYVIELQNLRAEETQAYIDDWTEAEAERTKEEEAALEERARLEEKQRQAQMAAWKQFYSELGNTVMSVYSSIVSIQSGVTDQRIKQIESERDTLLASLGLQEESEKEKLQRELEEARENGDMETAQEKAKALERLRIEEETDQKIAQLQRQQAERERQYSIFEATINMLASVVKFLVDPGGLAGIALSALAAATGAAQIAAIQAQPLPSYDIGAYDISEDHIARVHQGEMIIPKAFADSVRDGEMTIGEGSEGSNVEVYIYNYTGEEVRTEESNDQEVRRLKVIIGQTVDSQIGEGRYDSALSNRYGLRRNGRNG